jgi:hypothetical protein
MLMSVLDGMSESERQHVQAVRAAMDAQVSNEGRHQGGRAPYGYVVVDGGLHPNPRTAAEGSRLRVLQIEEPAAERFGGSSASISTATATGPEQTGSIGTASFVRRRSGRTRTGTGRGRLAGKYGPRDSGEPSLHRLRLLRKMGQAGDLARL